MVAPTSHKVLTLGPPSGRITELISKVAAIQSKHGPFAALFVLGDVFAPSETLSQPELDLLAGTLSLPIPTYFFLGSAPLPAQVAQKVAQARAADKTAPAACIAHNLFYLGKSGVAQTNEGFRAAFCGGTWDAAQWARSLSAASAQDDGPDPEAAIDTVVDDDELPYITSTSVQRLLSDPSFAQPKPLPSAQPSHATPAATRQGAAGDQPQTLAAARAQAKAAAATAEAASENASLLESRPPLDFLLTTYWPSGISLFSNAPLPDDSARIWGCAPLANVARAGAPRYHFALAPGSDDATAIVGLRDEVRQTGAFWEREPYLNDLAAVFGVAQQQPSIKAQDQGWATRRRAAAAPPPVESVTRFISLARFANAKKARWFLALNLVPASLAPPAAKPGNTTASPYFSAASAGGGAGMNGKRAPGTGGAAAETEGGGDLEAGPNFRFSEDSRKRRRTGQPGAPGERDDGPPPAGYRCRICGSEEHYIRLCPQKGARGGAAQQQQQHGEEGGATSSSDVNGAAPMTAAAAAGLAGLPSRPTEAAALAMPTRQKLLPVGPEDCWFCLSNPQCAKHLIVSIGEETYLALPKGALLPSSSSSSSASAVPGGGHVLIVPMTHFGSLFEADDATVARETMRETQQVKARLRAQFEGAGGGAGMVSWEIGKSSQSGSRVGHTMTQCVAIPASKRGVGLRDALAARAAEARIEFVTEREEVEEFFRPVLSDAPEVAAADGIDAKEGSGRGRGLDYMLLELDDGQQWLLKTRAGARWSVQFVRQALAAYLDIPSRADWKACQRTDEEEREDVKAFREFYNRPLSSPPHSSS